MASPVISRAPLCLSCIRRISAGVGDALRAPSAHQIRGKTKQKLPKATTINVRLLQNIPRYGRQGLIIPVAPGRMRNDWYPRGRAEYVTPEQLKALGEDAVRERDSTFGVRRELVEEEASQEEEQQRQSRKPASKAAVVEVKLLSPERSAELVSELLPPSLDFYRTPIATPEVKVEAPKAIKRSPSLPAAAALSAAAREGIEEEQPAGPSKQVVNIYGSVSTSDIAANLKAILAEHEEGARVVLSPEDITFVEEMDEGDRIKQLGSFEIDIKVKGATAAVRRTINVQAQD